MSKIQDILSEITSFLEGKDHSNSARFRSLAEEYASVCSDVEMELSKCKKMIDSGLALQSLQTNNQFSPSLTERARMLMFPGRTKWIGLCVTYNAKAPIEFDMELIEKLESGEFGKAVENAADLQNQWRVAARTGTNHEKIVLLRKLVKTDSTTKVWLQNLETVERAWIIDLQAEAKTAQALGDMPHLYSLYNLMISPELLHPTRQTILNPFLNDIRLYQKFLMQKKQETAIQKIEAAYDQKNLEDLQNSLSEWNDLTKNPLFQEETSSKQIVDEAKQLLEILSEQRDSRQHSADLQNQLTIQLDEHADFKDIEKTYHSLKQIDGFGIDTILERRYNQFLEKYNIEQKRRHLRILVIWIIFSVFAAAIVSFSIFEVQNYLETNKICSEMRAFINENSPDRALKYYDTLTKNNPSIASEDAVLAVKNEAEQKKEIIENGKKAYDELLAKIDEYLKEEKIEQEEVDALFGTIENFSGYHTQTQKNQLIAMQMKRTELLRIKQEKRDLDFQKKFETFRNDAFKLDTELENKDTVNLDEKKSALNALRERALAYKKNLEKDKISKNIYEKECRDFDAIRQNLQKKIEKVEDYQSIVKQLLSPKTFENYRTGLVAAPKTAPHIYALFPSAAQQISMIENWQNIENAIHSGMDLETHKKIYTAVSSAGDPYCRDIKFLMSGPDTLPLIMKEIDTWKDEMPDWKLYEVALPFEGKNIYFYLRKPEHLLLERATVVGGAYRFISFTLQLPKQSDTIVFSIEKENGVYSFMKKTDASNYNRIPDKISGISASVLANFGAKDKDGVSSPRIKLSPHYELLLQTFEKLQKIKTIEEMDRVLFMEILEYSKHSDINPAAKVAIIIRLLSIYSRISDFHKLYVQKIRESFGESQLKTSWMMPDVMIREAHILEKMNNFFASDSFKTLKKTADLTRDVFENVYRQKPIPAGVLYVKDKKISCHFFNEEFKSEEYFICLQMNNELRFHTLPMNLIQTGSIEIASLPAALTQIKNGDLFFVTQTRQSLYKQILPEIKFPAGQPPNLFRMPASLPENSVVNGNHEK